ncbi:uncharacterized protein LOC131946277 [Physella acuta]|uniref:uncharacterized protein LOC131946277 n=1 Tax=Physella acuta TaxID=109671 RepID=UPI0027DDCA91|nr:uncharacterized protein LOC131946277 [Physella acuta]
MVILPATFTGSTRRLHEYAQDAMTYVRNYGHPDLFITFTCHRKWDEIKELLLPGQSPVDRHDIIAHVFKQKLKSLMDFIVKHHVFGETRCWIYSIEWQIRGLPHSHILVWLFNKITPDKIDEIISAEIPDINISVHEGCIDADGAEQETFCGVMDLPKPVAKSSYIIINKTVHAACTTVQKISVESAAALEYEQSKEIEDQLSSTRYTGFVGDGDTNTYKKVCDSKPYGEKLIEKLECVGHVQKRVGTRLRNLKNNTKEMLPDGKRLGGKGRLTDASIDKLQSYYGNAIRENKNDIVKMRAAVWAVFFYKGSSDEKHVHNFCKDIPV